MANVKIQGEVVVDATGAEVGIGKAKKSLAGLGDAANAAGKKGAEGLNAIGDSGGKASKNVDAATKNMISSIQRTTAVVEAGGRANSRFFEVLASQRGIDVNALRPYLDSLDKVAAKQTQASAALGAGAVKFNQYGLSAKQSAAALRQVPAQLTDIVVSLQGGQAPLTVLLQQGGQLKDVFGGVVPAAKALGGAVLGLINPFTIAAGAVVGLGLAMASINSKDEIFAALSAQLIGTGRASVATVGDLKTLIRELNKIPGVSKDAATAIIGEFAKVQGLAGPMFRELGVSVADFAAATGTDMPSAAKRLAVALADPAKGVRDLDDALGTLTATQILVIEKMAATGDKLGAQVALMEALKTATMGLANQAMTPLGRATDNLSNSWDKLTTAIGDSDAIRSANIALAALLNTAATLMAELANFSPPAWLKYLPYFSSAVAAVNVIGGMRSSNGATGTWNEGGATGSFAPTKKELDDQVKAALEATKSYASQASAIDKLRGVATQAKAALAELETQNKGGSIEATALRDRIVGINEKMAEMMKKGAGPDLSRSSVNVEIARIQARAQELISTYGNTEKILEAQRSAGLTSETAYYAEKKRLLDLNAQAQADALNKENALLRSAKLKDSQALERDKKVIENEAKLAKTQADTATSQTVLDIQATAALKHREGAILSARQAAQDYYDTINRQQERELAAIGQGTPARTLGAGISQIEDRYSSQRRDVENQRSLAIAISGEGKLTKAQQDQFTKRIALIDEFQDRSVASYKAYFDRLTQLQGDWVLGADEGLKNYYAQTQNVFKQTEDVVGKAFQGMEDAIVKFVQTGKVDFKSLVDSIMADLLRIEIRKSITGPLSGAISSGGGIAGLFGSVLGLFGGTSGQAAVASRMGGDSLENMLKLTGAFGTRAIGGPVSSGGIYQVNENGPELLNVAGKQYLMMGNQSGEVKPSAGTSNQTYVTVQVTPPPGSNPASAGQWGATAGRAIQRSLARNN